MAVCNSQSKDAKESEVMLEVTEYKLKRGHLKYSRVNYLLIPDGSHHRPGELHLSQLATLLFRDDFTGLNVSLPDDHSFVGLEANRNLVSDLVERELTGLPTAGRGQLHALQLAVFLDEES